MQPCIHAGEIKAQSELNNAGRATFNRQDSMGKILYECI